MVSSTMGDCLFLRTIVVYDLLVVLVCGIVDLMVIVFLIIFIFFRLFW